MNDEAAMKAYREWLLTPDGIAVATVYDKEAAMRATWLAGHRARTEYPDKLPCDVKCYAGGGEGGMVFTMGCGTNGLLGYLTRRVEYNNLPPITEEQRAAFKALREPELNPESRGRGVMDDNARGS